MGEATRPPFAHHCGAISIGCLAGNTAAGLVLSVSNTPPSTVESIAALAVLGFVTSAVSWVLLGLRGAA